jgi:hypothetical protein
LGPKGPAEGAGAVALREADRVVRTVPGAGGEGGSGSSAVASTPRAAPAAQSPAPAPLINTEGLARTDRRGRRGQLVNSKAAPLQNLVNLDVSDPFSMAESAKQEIDQLATRVADRHGGKVAKAPLKSRERARQKIDNDYRGDPSKIKDLARNTIVVPRGEERAALDTLMRENPNIRPEHVKVVDAESNPLGYSGINVSVPTQSGLPGEIQINSPEMIYAKEHPNNSKAILGDSAFSELASRPDLPPGGEGHAMYEEWRTLPEDSQHAQEVASRSREYYNAFRR